MYSRVRQFSTLVERMCRSNVFPHHCCLPLLYDISAYWSDIYMFFCIPPNVPLKHQMLITGISFMSLVVLRQCFSIIYLLLRTATLEDENIMRTPNSPLRLSITQILKKHVLSILLQNIVSLITWKKTKRKNISQITTMNKLIKMFFSSLSLFLVICYFPRGISEGFVHAPHMFWKLVPLPPAVLDEQLPFIFVRKKAVYCISKNSSFTSSPSLFPWLVRSSSLF